METTRVGTSAEPPPRGLKVSFHIPAQGNKIAGTDERKNIEAAYDEVMTLIYELANGYSTDGFWSRLDGVYRMRNQGGPDDKAEDRLLRFFIIFPEPCREALDELESILADFAIPQKADQESMYLEIQHNVEVRFVSPKAAER